jgi:GDP/UDP-N,N'-diacetylbacillosamine 2-epimerase (hydrolysing)
VHISGGETTIGAVDEAIRHSITKMAWWHFVATKDYEKRVIQLGENPERIFLVGGLGVDAIVKADLLNKKELEKRIKFTFGKKNLLVTFHPVTLEKETSEQQCAELLSSLGRLYNTCIIFTAPNADTEGRVIKKMINEYVSNHPKTSIFIDSMGQLNYMSALKYVDAMVGNSSSGIVEAPTLKIGTINIGDRQKGRVRASSIIDCDPTLTSINKAFEQLYSNKFQSNLKNVVNPYGNGLATEKIIKILKDSIIPKEIKKEFYDL